MYALLYTCDLGSKVRSFARSNNTFKCYLSTAESPPLKLIHSPQIAQLSGPKYSNSFVAWTNL